MKEIKDLELILVKPDSAKKLADAVTKYKQNKTNKGAGQKACRVISNDTH